VKASRPFLKDRRWPALRLRALRRDGFACVQCGARGRLEVDHIQPTFRRPDLAFDLGNLQALCGSCHSRKTWRDLGRAEVSEGRREWLDLVRRRE